MAKLTLNTIGSRYGSIDALNDNFNAIEQAIENTLSLDGTSPNAMTADLDMNSNDVLNVGELDVTALRINGVLAEPGALITTGQGAAFQTYVNVASQGQTTFSVAPATPYVESITVSVNGLQLLPTELSVSGTNVITPALTAGDEVIIRRYTADVTTVVLSGTLGVPAGGTGQISYTDGELLIGNTTGNTLTKSTLTAGQGIAVTNGSGSITLSSMPLTVVTGTTQAAVANNHYVVTNVATTTVTLPASPTAGTLVWITVGNGLSTNVVARNGSNIQSLAQDLTLDSSYASVQMRYINSTIGWTFV